MLSESLVEQRRIRTFDCHRQLLKDPSRLSPDTLLALRLRSSKKWYTESFVKPKVSMAIGRKVYAEGMSAYFWHFLAAASSAASPPPRGGSDIRVRQGAHNCDVPYQQLL